MPKTVSPSAQRTERPFPVLASDRSGWDIPGMPMGLQWALLFFLPLAAAGYCLWSKLGALPEDAWSWTVYPGALLGAILLMPVNWGLECFKWAELLPWAPMRRRVREVLYGTAWSLIGPFRLGAGIGRISAVQKRERNMAMRAFAAACVSQWWCTITGAGIGLLVAGYWMAGMSVALISAMALGLYLGWTPGFWNTLKTTPFCGNWGLTRRIATIRRKRALNLSIARYVIMVVQFVLLLNAFGHHASMDHWVGRMFEQVEGVSLTWGLTSLVPMPALGDLGIREAAALLTIPAPEPMDATAIIGATLTLWVLNILIPALVGLVWHASAQRRINGLRTNLGA